MSLIKQSVNIVHCSELYLYLMATKNCSETSTSTVLKSPLLISISYNKNINQV